MKKIIRLVIVLFAISIVAPMSLTSCQDDEPEKVENNDNNNEAEDEDDRKRCSICKGTGVCQRCGGTGEIWSVGYEDWIRCERCIGSGECNICW